MPIWDAPDIIDIQHNVLETLASKKHGEETEQALMRECLPSSNYEAQHLFRWAIYSLCNVRREIVKVSIGRVRGYALRSSASSSFTS